MRANMGFTILPFEFWKRFTKYTLIGSSLLMLLYSGVLSLSTTSAKSGPESAEAKHQVHYRSSSDARAVAIANSYSSSGGQSRDYNRPTYYHYPAQYPTQYPTRIVYNDPVTYNYDVNYRYPQYPQPMPSTIRSDCRHHCFYPSTTPAGYWSGWNPNQYPGGAYNYPTYTTNYWTGWNPHQYPGGDRPVGYWADWNPGRYPTY